MKTIRIYFVASATFLILILFSCRQSQMSQPVVEERTVDVGLYQEQHRPQFHFSPAQKWMNDPNGMVYYEGEYHLFYQFYPDSTVWGPMHWGHAISEDLVHWEHLPIALYPDSLGYIFSGSAVIDWNNSSGLGRGNHPPMVAIFTHHDPVKEKAGNNDFQYQSIAYSNDKGRTWAKYEGNPVVPNLKPIRDFRDPKVIWDSASEQWVMVFAANDHVKFYGSKNLKDWDHLSDWGKAYGEHGGVWECPDIFPMKVEGTDEEKWVLLQSLNPGGPNGGSATQYFVGEFDGKNFLLDPSFESDVSDGKAVWLDYGRDNYAGVTWSDVPKEDGRRLFMGWMSNWDYATIVPTGVWRSAMTLPRALTLHKVQGDYRVFSSPVAELDKLRSTSVDIPSQELSEGVALEFSPEKMEISLQLELLDKGADVGIELSNDLGETYRIGYRAIDNSFYSDRSEAGDLSFSSVFGSEAHLAPRLSSDKSIDMRIFFDQASVELFADGGGTVLTDIFFPTENFNKATLYVKDGRVKVEGGKTYLLDSIWL